MAKSLGVLSPGYAEACQRVGSCLPRLPSPRMGRSKTPISCWMTLVAASGEPGARPMWKPAATPFYDTLKRVDPHIRWQIANLWRHLQTSKCRRIFLLAYQIASKTSPPAAPKRGSFLCITLSGSGGACARASRSGPVYLRFSAALGTASVTAPFLIWGRGTIHLKALTGSAPLIGFDERKKRSRHFIVLNVTSAQFVDDAGREYRSTCRSQSTPSLINLTSRDGFARPSRAMDSIIGQFCRKKDVASCTLGACTLMLQACLPPLFVI